MYNILCILVVCIATLSWFNVLSKLSEGQIDRGSNSIFSLFPLVVFVSVRDQRTAVHQMYVVIQWKDIQSGNVKWCQSSRYLLDLQHIDNWVRACMGWWLQCYSNKWMDACSTDDHDITICTTWDHAVRDQSKCRDKYGTLIDLAMSLWVLTGWFIFLKENTHTIWSQVNTIN